MAAIRTAFILGAGLGLRLRPLTETVPKPLLRIGSRPMITYAMDHLIAAGIERLIVNTHHLPGAYQEMFPDWSYRGTPIIFRHEPVLLDTGGGLKNIEDLVESEQGIIVYNGDILTNISLEGFMEYFRSSGAEVCLALRSSGHLLNVDLDGTGAVCDMRGILGRRGAEQCQFTGIYAVKRKFLRRFVPGRIESVVPALVRLIESEPGAVRGIKLDGGYWHDIGSIEEYRKVDREFSR